ncbi:unnamed protein product [Cuscuta campestris]|uniref:Uncharacterized protein n=2 Tax=Cuscuta sect. Cleistogrammica TaxID=1824901 RepID=A0A484MPG8_9ASTE|nr:hypothetical protein DM860_013822 [Cuscuta australis]VFQ90853.1 unnamed protein product [Cuscuta campestris]
MQIHRICRFGKKPKKNTIHERRRYDAAGRRHADPQPLDKNIDGYPRMGVSGPTEIAAQPNQAQAQSVGQKLGRS